MKIEILPKIGEKVIKGEHAEAIKEIEELQKEIEQKKKEIIENYKIITEPRKIRKAFLKSQKWKDKIKNKYLKIPIPKEQELQEPVLFLMKENGFVEPIEGVKAGEFIISTPKGEKGIILSPDKLRTLKYGEQYIQCWWAYENCMSPYPENPIHNAEMYRKTTQKLAMNWRDRDETAMITAKTKMWLYIIGGIVIAIVLLLSTDFGKNLIAGIGKETAKTTIQTIQQNATAIVNTGKIAVG